MNSFRLRFLLKSLILIVSLVFINFTAKAQIDFEILSGDAQICLGDSTLLSIDAAVDSITWSPAIGVSMPNSLSTFVTPMGATTYFATLYSEELTQVVPIQVDIVSVAMLGNDVSVCSNGSDLNYDFSTLPFPGDYQMTASNAGFNIVETSTNVFNVDITNVPAGTYELSVSNPACNQSDTIQVEVVAGLAAQLNFTAEDSAICIGEEVNFSVFNVPGQTYEWTGNGAVLSSTTSITDNPAVTTTYVITAVGNSCTVPTQDSVTITVNSDPSISLPATMNACENDTVQLGSNIAQVGTIYSWTPVDNIIDPSVVNADLFVVEDGTYILTANNGCEIMDTIEITMIDNDIDLVDTIFVCLGGDATINFTTNPPNDAVSWTTLDGAPLVNVPTPFTVTPDDVVSYIATVENMGCTFMDTVTLQVDSLPMNLDIEFIEFNNAPAPICIGDTVQLQTLPVFDETFFPNIEFQWLAAGNINNGPDSEYLTPDTLFQLVFIAQETKIYSRIHTNGACIDTTEVEVPVVPILEIDVTPLDPVCPFSTGTLTGTAMDPISMMDIDPQEIEWEWMMSPGTIEPAEGMGENTPTASVEATTAIIDVTATYLGCPAMAQFELPVFSTPALGFPNTQICFGETLMLNNGFVGPNYTFQWSSTSNDLGGQENSANPTVNPLQTTTYSVTVTNGACEPVMDQVTINIFDAAGSLADPIELSGCIGEMGTLSIPAGFIGGPGAIYSWTAQSTGATFTGESIDISINNDEIYIITVSNNCVQNQFVGQAIVTSISNSFESFSDNFVGCSSVDGGATQASIPAGYNGGPNPNYQWFDNGGMQVGSGTTLVLSPGAYTVELTNDLCAQSQTIGNVVITSQSVIEAIINCDPDTTIYQEGQIIDFSIANPIDGVTYEWTSQNNSNFNTNNDGTTAMYVAPDADMDVISISATDGGVAGCPITGSKTIAIDRVRLPNIFTPGGSENNTFFIDIGEGAEITNLQIYDRWGNKVYDNDNVDQEWDGNINGEPAPSEVYIYIVTYEIPGQGAVTRSSDLTLLR